MNILLVTKYRDGFLLLKRGNTKYSFEYTQEKMELESFLDIKKVVLTVEGYMFRNVEMNVPKPLIYNSNKFIPIDVLQEEQETLDGYILRAGKRLPNIKDEMDIVEVIDELLYVADIVEEIYNKRKFYFQSKLDIIKDFNLSMKSVKDTRGSISSTVLKATKKEYEDRLDFSIKVDNIPPAIRNFYEDIKKDFLAGTDYKELESRKKNILIANVEHTLGFGGIHGAVKNIVETGNLMYIDFTSFYPILMIEHDFLSRSVENKEDFKEILEKRLELKQQNDKKEASYKIVLNSTYGAMKSEFSDLYDPLQANNVVINGQLISVELLRKLAPYIKLIQTNTDGIIFKYYDREKVLELIKQVISKYKLKVNVEYPKKIIQRDVNNFLLQNENGTYKAKGIYKANKSLPPIVSHALKEQYINNIPIFDTVSKEYNEHNYLMFQTVYTLKNDTDMFYSLSSHKKYDEKSIRVFATKTGNDIYKKTKGASSKLTNTSNNSMVYNGDLNTSLHLELDLSYYVDLIEKYNF